MSERKSLEDEADHGFKKAKPSMLYTAKKNLASKLGGNKMGQDVIKSYLGDNGAMLANTLSEAAIQDCGKERAKQLVAYVYQLCLKTKILHDEKLITTADRKDFVHPVNTLSVELYQTLEAASPLEGEEEQKADIDVTGLALKVAQLAAQISNLLSKELKEKSIGKLNQCMEYFGGKHFLSQIFNNPEFSEFKARLTAGLFALIKERLTQADLLPSPRPCRTPRCIEDALPRNGRFAGSLYCYDCHVLQYKRLLASPSIKHFLVENGKTHQPIQLKIKNGLPANVPQILNALYNYREAKPALRRIFAEGLFEKYFAEKAHMQVECVKKETIATLKEQVYSAEQKEGQDPELFAQVEQEVTAITDPFFEKEIVGSADFKQYLSSRKAPAAFSPEVRASTITG